MNWGILSGERLRLGAVDRKKDAEVESGWSHEAAYMHVVDPRLPRPFSASQMEKRYEDLEKQMGDRNNMVYFALRALDDNRLLGFLQYSWIGWSLGLGSLRLAIGAPERGNGYGREALQLGLTYAFDELNLQTVAAWVHAANERAVRLFTRAGFREDARRREALVWQGRRCDELVLGLQRSEWLLTRQEEL
jgi:RimJ/RimL family protein N-acetyltransferase